MASDTDSAVSGGLLVVLGILVALGAVYFFYHTRGSSGPDINIQATVPTPKAD